MDFDEALDQMIPVEVGRVAVAGKDVLVFTSGSPDDFLASTLGKELTKCCHKAGTRLHVDQDFHGVRVAPLTGSD